MRSARASRVIGGGSGGRRCARRAWRPKVAASLVLERTSTRAFTSASRSCPQSLEVLEAIGVLDDGRGALHGQAGRQLRRRLGRPGARRATPSPRPSTRSWDHAFQVPRDEFDELLLRHAERSRRRACARSGRRRACASTGARRGRRRGRRSGHGLLDRRATSSSTPPGATRSSRGRAVQGVSRIPELDKTALFTQVSGARRDEGAREGDIQIVDLRRGGTAGSGSSPSRTVAPASAPSWGARG